MKLKLPASSAWLVQRLIHATARWTRPLTVGVRAVIADGEERICLVKHSYVPGWHLPGGAVEPGETALQAVIREVREECGIEVTGPPRLHGIFFNAAASRRDHVLVYAVRTFEQRGPRTSDWEIIEAGFFASSDLPQGTTRATRRRVREVLEGIPPETRW